LGFVQRFISWHTVRGQTLGKALVQLFGPYASSAVEGEVPCNANQPYPHITHLGESAMMLENSNKDVLNDVLGFDSTTQD
jgi:hypothetical protein